MISKIKLHKEGPEFSRLVYGAWRLNEDKEGTSTSRILKKVEACLEIGISTFDHADIYGDYSCEELFGKALKANPSLYSRLEIVSKCDIMLISSKHKSTFVKHYDSSKEHIIKSVENSLKNLGVEKLDLLLLHRPDPILNPEEVSLAFQALKKSGKVLHFGVSNFTASQVSMLSSYLEFPIVTNQIEIHLNRLDSFHDGTLDQCLEKRFSPMAWSPFAGGKLLSNQIKPELEKVLNQYSEKKSCTREELLLSWLCFTPHKILPIIGTNQIERIHACKNFESVKLDRQEWFDIYSSALGKEVP
ncbi:MAG: aldo/keto reductase [Leptospiraceae bacterium]|nr:aldo/keto reductase [Leptospiraceae bacterium]